MEDQILTVDSMDDVDPDENPFKKLLRKEERLTAKLKEEQEAEARAQDRLRRAQTREAHPPPPCPEIPLAPDKKR